MFGPMSRKLRPMLGRRFPRWAIGLWLAFLVVSALTFLGLYQDSARDRYTPGNEVFPIGTSHADGWLAAAILCGVLMVGTVVQLASVRSRSGNEPS
jgi:hypothetical protein